MDQYVESNGICAWKILSFVDKNSNWFNNCGFDNK
jgi:hypothetical protein